MQEHFATLNGKIDKNCIHFLVLIPPEKLQKRVDFFPNWYYNIGKIREEDTQRTGKKNSKKFKKRVDFFHKWYYNIIVRRKDNKDNKGQRFATGTARTLKSEQHSNAEGKSSNSEHGIRLCIIQKVGQPVRRRGYVGGDST